METVKIQGELRDTSGKHSAREVRSQGLIPAVIYGGEKNIHFSTSAHEVKPVVYTPDFKLAEIHLNGETHRVLLKDIQIHPVTDEILHLDFLKLRDGRPIKVDVPIKFTGESPGVKNGGKLIQSLRKLTIKTTPEHLVDELTADISGLKLNQTIRVRDLASDENVEILHTGSAPIATVLIPRALVTAVDEEEAEGEAEEGEEGAEGEDSGAAEEKSEGQE